MIDRLHWVCSKHTIPRTWYVYAERGGPRIMRHVGHDKPTLTTEAIALLAQYRAGQPERSERTLSDLIDRFQRNQEWTKLAAGTKKTWGSQLKTIEGKWGTAPLAIFSDRRMREKILEWRDSRSETPRGADLGITVLSRLLDFGVDRGLIKRNPAERISKLYQGGGRAAIIWLDEDAQRFIEKANELEQPHIADALRLAAATGLRRQDLVRLSLDDIQPKILQILATKRSRGRRFSVTIPRYLELDQLIDELKGRKRQPGVRTLLVNSYGIPWTAGGLTGSFNRVRDAAGIWGEDEAGQRTAKHLHDLRGTFCTKLCRLGLTNQQIASVMGWSPEQVDGIRSTYVDHTEIVRQIASRIGEGL